MIRLHYLPGFILFFIKELISANIKVAVEVLRPTLAIAPKAFKLPLKVSQDRQITLLANMITLTPGTLSLEVSKDRKTLLIHTLYGNEVKSIKSEIKNKYEPYVMRLLP